MSRIINSRSAMVFAFSLAVLIGGNASAVERTWTKTNPPDGTFQTSSNWSGGVVPGTGDIARFSMCSALHRKFQRQPCNRTPVDRHQ